MSIDFFENKIFHEDAITLMKKMPESCIDLIVVDPPYNLGKDYGNDSDRQESEAFLNWTYTWLELAVKKLKPNGCLYIFTTWRYSPEIFVFLKKHLIMLNEIIWDRKVPSMGGSTRRYSSVHDTVGFFAKSKDYYFDLDAIRIPYDEETKKARSRSIFVGKKWLEMGYNPKDVWSISRLHKIHSEREEHPTQKPLEVIERMIKASCPEGGIVFDPFAGSGTTLAAAAYHQRNYIGCEINFDYVQMIHRRLQKIKDTLPQEMNQSISLIPRPAFLQPSLL